MELDCGRAKRKSARSKPVPATGKPLESTALVASPVKLNVPRPFWSVWVFRSLRLNCAPQVNVCLPRDQMTLSLALWLRFRARTGVASLNAPKLVKFKLGGPKFSGFEDVPAMPSSAATSGPLAKNGVVSLRLRL